ncbi:MAG: hypothetical protein AABW82_03055 [Nanoarchaeota archaeon]
MKVTILVVKMFFVAALFIISNQNLYMSNVDDRGTFYDYYTNWIDTLFHQAFVISGYVVKFEWLPSNNGTINSVLTSGNASLSEG